MTTAIFWNAPGDVDYRELVLPEPGPGEVLIENVYSLVSPGTEREWLSSAESHFPLGTTFPFVPGYSAAGHIIAVGPEVKGWSTGDAVVATPLTGCHASHLIAPASADLPNRWLRCVSARRNPAGVVRRRTRPAATRRLC
jgi:NADPH:quinone reductase-like Zn-dependent oxidoreductase